MSSRIRVVVAKPGLDGHDRGAKVVARALRDAGMEVIYTGLHQTPEQIVETAIQEDADAVGLSVLSGAHMTLFKRVVELLTDRQAADIVVFGGGIIPEADIPELERLGVAKIFTPGRHHRVDRRLGTGERGPAGRLIPGRGRGRTHPSHARPLYARCPAATPRPTGHRPLPSSRLTSAPTSDSTTPLTGGYAPTRTSPGRLTPRLSSCATATTAVHYRTPRTRSVAAGSHLVRLRQMACLF